MLLELAARCGVLQVGGITVAIDGTKVLANASKHAAVSYEHAGEQMRELDLEIERLLRKAEEADSTPLEEGLSIPQEVQRRAERKAKLAAARAEMELRAQARIKEEKAAYEGKMAEREKQRQNGKKPRGREPHPPQDKPGNKDQMNFTDPESRIMKSAGGFEQSYNAQAAVEVDSRLIVGQRVSNAPNDREQLLPGCRMIQPAAGAIKEVLVDSGFLSEGAVTEIEKSGAVRVLAAVRRESHGRRVEQLEKKADPPAPALRPPSWNAWPIAWRPKRDERATNCASKLSSPSLALSRKSSAFAASHCADWLRLTPNGPWLHWLITSNDSSTSKPTSNPHESGRLIPFDGLPLTKSVVFQHGLRPSLTPAVLQIGRAHV